MRTTNGIVLLLDVLIWALAMYLVLLSLHFDDNAEARRHYYEMRGWQEAAVWCGRRALAAEQRYLKAVQP